MELKSAIIEHNKNIILTYFLNTSVQRRLINECVQLYDLYENVTVEYSQNKLFVTILEIINNKQYSYGFQISDNYPFESPKIYYQGKPYITYLKIYGPTMINLLKQIAGIDCLCCSSYNCKTNWYPVVTMDSIIGEIKQYKEYKSIIIFKILSEKIKNKYLIEDIDIDCWLF
jgi:ubiquitin-protein ligase